MAHYAWSPIRAGTAEKPVNAAMGDQVDAGKLGISKEDFEALVESGAVREIKPPKMEEGFQGSVVEYYQEQARKAAEAAGATADEARLAAFHAAAGQVEEA